MWFVLSEHWTQVYRESAWLRREMERVRSRTCSVARTSSTHDTHVDLFFNVKVRLIFGTIFRDTLLILFVSALSPSVPPPFFGNRQSGERAVHKPEQHRTETGEFWCFKLVMEAREIVPRLTLFTVEGDTVVSYTNEPRQNRSSRVLTLVGRAFYGQVCFVLLSLIVSSGGGGVNSKGCGEFLVL